MTTDVSHGVARLMKARQVNALDVMGAVVEFLTLPTPGKPCVMRGTILPGASVPLHAHADPETFFMVSGEMEGLSHTEKGCEWLRLEPGDVFHVPSGVRHAFRNRGAAAAVMIILATDRIGWFFQEIGVPTTPDGRPSVLPTDEMIRRFMETAERYGYWNASPDENARVGISLPGGQ